MLEGFNDLVRLSKLDMRLAELEAELATLPAKRATAAEERRAGEARVEAAGTTIAESEQAQRRWEGVAQDKEALLAKLEGQQHQVKTNEAYTVLLAEMDQAREAISEAETGVLEAMEAIEAARAERAAVEAEVRRVVERLESEEQARSEREKALLAEIESLRESRREQVGALDPDLLAPYEKVAARRRPAVAVVSGEICLGCRVGIPPQAYIEILRGTTLVTCNHCHRILIHRDQLSAG